MGARPDGAARVGAAPGRRTMALLAPGATRMTASHATATPAPLAPEVLSTPPPAADDTTVGAVGKPAGGRTGPVRRPDPPLPAPRGELSAFLLEHLRQDPHELPPAPGVGADPIRGDDEQLALYCSYELHYRGFEGVDPAWEWEPSLVAWRRELERAFEAGLREEVGPIGPVEDIVAALDEIATPGDGPSLSDWLFERGGVEHVHEFCVHRTAWQLKEADPHTWVIPRLHGGAKAALVHIQADEYGLGVEEDVHAELYALCLRQLGLDDAYGAYLDRLPGATLAGTNAVTMFGLHRRLRGAAVGHLAIFEMFSVLPMQRVSDTLARLGASSWARLFFDTHVVADADHQTIAARDLAGGLVAQDPRLATDVLFGAHAIGVLEAEATRRTITAWEEGRSSLLGTDRLGGLAREVAA
jgi:hypothetical protein